MIFVPLFHPKQPSQFQILLETSVVFSPLSLTCCLSTFQQLGIEWPQQQDRNVTLSPQSSQLSGQNTKVWKDSLIHTLATLILLSKSADLHQKQLHIHSHNLPTFTDRCYQKNQGKYQCPYFRPLRELRNYVSIQKLCQPLQFAK